MIDTHAHLNDDRFAEDLDAVVERSRSAGVVKVVTIGIDVTSSRTSIQLAETYPDLLVAAVGIQPNHVAEASEGDWEEIVQLASSDRVVALGETGLDRYWDRAPFPRQEKYFALHLELMRQVDKPVLIHCREAAADVVRMLQSEYEARGPIRGLMHSFCDDAATAEACVRFGLFISLSGMLTYKNADALRSTVATIPLDRLLVETDSPYLAPTPHRGKRNEPAFVRHTTERVAEIRGIPFAEMAEIVTENAKAFFNLK